jgi:hypothetical protein
MGLLTLLVHTECNCVATNRLGQVETLQRIEPDLSHFLANAIPNRAGAQTNLQCYESVYNYQCAVSSNGDLPRKTFLFDQVPWCTLYDLL